MKSQAKSDRMLTRREALRLAAAAGAGLVISQLPVRSQSSGFPTFLTKTSAQQTTLRHLVALNPDMAPAYKEVISGFEKEHPNIKVSFDLVPFTEAVTKVSQAAAVGRPYDVIDAGSEENQWQLLEQGLFEPLTDLVDGLGAGKYFAPTALTKWKGEYWMAPYLIIPLHIEYRKDLFEAKGLRAPFRTWDEWLDAAKALTDIKVQKYGFLMPLQTHYFYSTLHSSMLLSNGGHILDRNGKVVFNSPENIEMLGFTKRLATYCVPNMGEQGADDMQTLFYKDVTAMTWYSELDIVPNTKKLNPQLKGKIGIMPIPPRTANQTPVLRTTTQFYSVGKGSAYAKQAKDYIRYLLRMDNEVKIIRSVPMANVPAVTAAKDAPELFADPDIQENKQVYLDYIEMAAKYGRSVSILENPGVFNPKTGQILRANLLIQCVQDVVLNGVPPEKAAAKWAARMEEVVKRS